MRRALFALLVSGCCFAPTAAPVETPAGPSGPGAPGCPDLGTSIVGTWARAGFVEEYRADGTYVINGAAGTYRWISPGHATLDEPTHTFHADYDLGLADSTTLVAIDPNGVGTIYTRSSPTPSIPENCLDLRAAFARTWTPRSGGTPEVYATDGTYRAPGVGRWSFPAPGRLHLVRDDGVTSDYVVAMPSTAVMLAVTSPPGPPLGVAYAAAP